MYSYPDRFPAVELYIRLGKRVKATIPQLGYAMAELEACRYAIIYRRWATTSGNLTLVQYQSCTMRASHYE